MGRWDLVSLVDDYFRVFLGVEIINIADSSLLPSSRRIHHPHEIALNLALELYSAVGRKKETRKDPS